MKGALAWIVNDQHKTNRACTSARSLRSTSSLNHSRSLIMICCMSRSSQTPCDESEAKLEKVSSAWMGEDPKSKDTAPCPPEQHWAGSKMHGMLSVLSTDHSSDAAATYSQRHAEPHVQCHLGNLACCSTQHTKSYTCRH